MAFLLWRYFLAWTVLDSPMDKSFHICQSGGSLNGLDDSARFEHALALDGPFSYSVGDAFSWPSQNDADLHGRRRARRKKSAAFQRLPLNRLLRGLVLVSIASKASAWLRR